MTRYAASLAAILFLVACALDEQWWYTGVHKAEWEEIRSAIRKVNPSRVELCTRSPDDPNHMLWVYTADGKSYHARKIRGKWHFDEAYMVL